jgi:predicted phage terminase large subunit-like protein
LSQKLHLQARTNFRTFVKLCGPLVVGRDFKWGAHIDILCDELQFNEATEDDRLSISISPRSMKSILVHALYPAWIIGRHPNWQILGISHSASLAEGFSKKVRGLLREPLFQKIFPECKLSQDTTAASRWHTTAGGVYCAFGAGANIAGVGGHVIIMDDVLSEQMAKSKIEREKIIAWYPAGLRSRLMPGGRMVNLATRWAILDLTGYLLEQALTNPMADQWRVVNIPAVLDKNSSELLGLKEGTSYWPEMWSTERLLATRSNMTPGDWAAVYMQTPVPDEGAIFKQGYFKTWDRSKLNEVTGEKEYKPPTCEMIIQTIDTAQSKSDHADYSVIQTWGIFNQVQVDSGGKEHDVAHLILLANFRDRLEYPELRRKAQSEYKKWKPDLVLVEKKSFGGALIVDLQLAGVPVQKYLPDRDKATRAASVTPIMEIGRVWIPPIEKFPWARSLVEECLQFTANDTHPHDDQVDCLVLAIIYLKEGFTLTHKDDPAFDGKEEKRVPTYWSRRR